MIYIETFSMFLSFGYIVYFQMHYQLLESLERLDYIQISQCHQSTSDSQLSIGDAYY